MTTNINHFESIMIFELIALVHQEDEKSSMFEEDTLGPMNVALPDDSDNSASELASGINPENNIPVGATFPCSRLKFQQTDEKLEIETENGHQILSSGDILIYQKQKFQVLITWQQNSIVKQDPTAFPAKRNVNQSMNFNDIWSNNEDGVFSNSQAQLNDPFSHSDRQMESTMLDPIYTPSTIEKQDPLNFLYEPSVNKIDPMLSLLPSSMDNENNNYFSVNTASQNGRESLTTDYLPSHELGGENVLSTLGINDKDTDSPSSSESLDKNSYLEQSPADMLDTYLVEEQNRSVMMTPVSMEPQATNLAVPSSKPGFLNSLKNVFKSTSNGKNNAK